VGFAGAAYGLNSTPTEDATQDEVATINRHVGFEFVAPIKEIASEQSPITESVVLQLEQDTTEDVRAEAPREQVAEEIIPQPEPQVIEGTSEPQTPAPLAELSIAKNECRIQANSSVDATLFITMYTEGMGGGENYPLSSDMPLSVAVRHNTVLDNLRAQIIDGDGVILASIHGRFENDLCHFISHQ